MNIKAIIPARSGSTRLKNKNILPFNGTNLLVNKIRQLKKVSNLDDIIVSSDSDEYLEMALLEGVKIHKRTIEYSDEKTKSFGEVVAKICSEINCDDVLWATCTSPMVTPQTYIKAIQLYYENVPSKFDSLISLEPFKRYIWDDNGPWNYKMGIEHVPSQQLKQLYYVTDGILIAPRLKMIDWKYFHGSNPFKFLLDKISSLDIDTEEDYKICKSLCDYN